MAEGYENLQHVVFMFKCLFLRGGSRKGTGPMAASIQGFHKLKRDGNGAILGV